ncbi:MAG: hypothetical protein ACRCTA_06095 [Bacilli bacterium]
MDNHISNEFLNITISPLGSCITSLLFKNKNMIVRNDNPSLIDDYKGMLLGPTSGRIKNGFIKLDHTILKLTCNEANNHLHGGYDSLSTKLFSVTKVNSTTLIHSITTLLKEYQTTLALQVRYQLQGNTLLIKYHYHTTTSSYLNLSNHLYFNLGNTNNLNHKLYIDGLMACNDTNHLIRSFNPYRKYLFILDTHLLNNYFITSNKVLYYNQDYLLKITSSYPGMVIYNGYYSNYQGTCFEASYPNNDHHHLQKGKTIPNKEYKHYIKYHFFQRS